MKGIRLGTVLLLVVIVAQSLALVIQHRREAAQRKIAEGATCEMQASRQLALWLYEWVLQVKVAELERLGREVGDRNDPGYKAAAAQVERVRSEFLGTMQRWDAQPP